MKVILDKNAIMPLAYVGELEITDHFEETERGTGCLGSSGK